VICKPLLKLGKDFWKSSSIVYSFLSDRKRKKNGSEVPITFCNLITTKALKKTFIYKGAERQFIVKDAMFIISRAWNKEKNLSPRQSSNPDLPDTGPALLTRLLHTTGISVPCGDKYSGLRERAPHCKIDTLDNMKILLLQWVNAILKIGRGDRGL